jgi:hypothetical protein
VSPYNIQTDGFTLKVTSLEEISMIQGTTPNFIHSSMALQPFVGPWPLQFRNLFYTDGRTPLTSDQPVARPLPTQRTTQTQNKRIHRHPCLERAKTVHALDCAAIVIVQILTSGLFILEVLCLGAQILYLELSQMWQIGKVLKNNP